MNRLILLLFTFLAPLLTSAQGIEFNTEGWKEALAKAKDEGKLLFVDCYTTWCGPCKRMAKNVFTQASVGDYFNENFVSIKLDMEKERGMSFGLKYKVSAYPTMFFIDGNGKVVKKLKGARKAPDFLKEAQAVTGSYDRSGEYAEFYEKGDRDYELMVNYVTELNKAGKPSLKISNDYLNAKPEISEEQKAMFLFAATVDCDSRIFEQMAEEKASILSQVGQEAFEKKINSACKKTVDKGIEFDFYDLVIEAKEKMKLHTSKSAAKRFSVESDVAFYKNTGDFDGYLEAMKDYTKTYGKKDPATLKWAIGDLIGTFKDEKENKLFAEKLAKDLLKQQNTKENQVLYTNILVDNGNTKEAIKVVEKARKEAEKKGEPTQLYDKTIERIRNSK